MAELHEVNRAGKNTRKGKMIHMAEDYVADHNRYCEPGDEVEFVALNRNPYSNYYWADFRAIREDSTYEGYFYTFKCEACGEVTLVLVFDEGQIVNCEWCEEMHLVTEECEQVVLY
jgi:ribosomal protein S27E